MAEGTAQQYSDCLQECRGVFEKKTKDYGTSWRILRPSSLTDQLYIKAQRIRTIEQKGKQQIAEGVKGEFMALVNYGLMALIQQDKGWDSEQVLGLEEALSLYDEQSKVAFELMEKKNHDYGEAWRSMRISSFTDLILMKLLRIKEIEDNGGKTLISEGADANYLDIINYSLFALIKIKEEE